MGSGPVVLLSLPEYRRRISMPFVKCSVDGCNRRLQPIFKLDARVRTPGLPGVRCVPETRLSETFVGAKDGRIICDRCRRKPKPNRNRKG